MSAYRIDPAPGGYVVIHNGSEAAIGIFDWEGAKRFVADATKHTVKPLRIGIDLDECVYPFSRVLGDYITDTTGRKRSQMPAPTRWSFYEDWGYTTEQFLKFFEDAVDKGIMFAEGAPILGSLETLRNLKRDGHTLHIVTDRFVGRRSQELTGYWLQSRHVPFDTLTFAKDKTIVPTDVFIDDKPSNVDALREAGCSAYLYNRHRDDQWQHPALVDSWEAFEQVVDALVFRQQANEQAVEEVPA